MVRLKLVLVALLLIVIAGLMTTQSYREPSRNTARRCRAMPKASHPSDLLSANQLGKNGYLVWGRGVGPSGGVGNDFVFWPAVFSASLLSGRTPVLDDIGAPIFKLATICNSSSAYLACSVPLLSSVLTRDERLEISSKMVRVDVKDVLRKPDSRFLRVDGFFRYSNWWQNNKTLSRCVRNVLNCSESSSAVQKAGRHLCVERAAMQLLVGNGPGPGLVPFAESLSLRLVGEVDRNMIRDYLSRISSVNRHSSSPLFDAAVHLRLQFNRIEADGVSPRDNLKDLLDWLSRENHREIFEFFLSNLRTRIATYIGATITTPRVYLTADSEAVKVLFYEYLSQEYSVVYLPTDCRTAHLRKFEEFRRETDQWPSVIFDWLMMAKSNAIFSYRNAMLSVPIRYANDTGRWVYSGDRFVFQNRKGAWLENY